MLPTIVTWDHGIELWIAHGRNPLLASFYAWFTQLGDARTITVVATAVVIVLWRHRKWRYKVGFFVALLGSLLTAYGIKEIVHRARPDIALQYVHETGYSFPSMHAATSVATYGFLAYLALSLLHPPQHRKIVASAFVFLAFLIGFSRVYLGVHYTSDVLAGFVIGGIFVWIGIKTTEALKQKRNR